MYHVRTDTRGRVKYLSSSKVDMEFSNFSKKMIIEIVIGWLTGIRIDR